MTKLYAPKFSHQEGASMGLVESNTTTARDLYEILLHLLQILSKQILNYTNKNIAKMLAADEEFSLLFTFLFT